ncbi:MAG: hypothetical protein U1F11_07595 [Steroidobacteraceae bacterium]
MTLMELMTLVAVIGILVVVGVPGYRNYIDRARSRAAMADIGEIQMRIQRFELNNGGPPADLGGVGSAGKLDPWGRPYVYLSHAGLMGFGAVRKDKNLNPINSDYDLYSVGPDGESVAALTAKKSRDDIVRANDGRYIGVAADY